MDAFYPHKAFKFLFTTSARRVNQIECLIKQILLKNKSLIKNKTLLYQSEVSILYANCLHFLVQGESSNYLLIWLCIKQFLF